MQFYVYTLAYPDGRVFYVGKGQGDRINQHEQEARSGRVKNPYKVNVIRKIWAGGGEVVKEKVFESDDEYEAFDMEREYISYFGRSNLTNLTDGGEGMSGYEYTQEHKKNLSDSVLKHYWGDQYEEAREKSEDRHAYKWAVGLRRLEQYRVRDNSYMFDKRSMRKLYPSTWEEPGDFREASQDVMDLDEFITSWNNVY